MNPNPPRSCPCPLCEVDWAYYPLPRRLRVSAGRLQRCHQARIGRVFHGWAVSPLHDEVLERLSSIQFVSALDGSTVVVAPADINEADIVSIVHTVMVAAYPGRGPLVLWMDPAPQAEA